MRLSRQHRSGCAGRIALRSGGGNCPDIQLAFGCSDLGTVLRCAPRAASAGSADAPPWLGSPGRAAAARTTRNGVCEVGVQ